MGAKFQIVAPLDTSPQPQYVTATTGTLPRYFHSCAWLGNRERQHDQYEFGHSHFETTEARPRPLPLLLLATQEKVDLGQDPVDCAIHKMLPHRGCLRTHSGGWRGWARPPGAVMRD